MQDIVLFINANKFLVIAFISVLALLVLLEYIRQKQGTARLSPSMVTHFINHKDAVVIDIRNKEAYQAGHIIGALSIPLADWEKPATLSKVEKYKTKSLILVCDTGVDSAKRAEQLKQKGFSSLFSLAGGIRGWKEADMPLVKE